MNKNKKPGQDRLRVSSDETSSTDRALHLELCKVNNFVGIMQTLSEDSHSYKPYNHQNTVKSHNIPTQGQAGQLERVVDSFAESPKTMLQVSFETGIFRANICRYVANLRKIGRIEVHHKGLDPVTQHKACFLTTNPALFKPSVFNQLNLFD